MPTELEQQLLELVPGEHLCLFYDDDPAEQMVALVPFLKQGLAQREQCIYIADDQTTDQIIYALELDGVDVGQARKDGSLKVLTRKEWRQPGAPDIQRKGAQVRRLLNAAREAGFAGVRFAIEMTWTLGPDIMPDQLGWWEAALNDLVGSSFPTRIVCQYSRKRLSPLALQAALRTHPQVILGDRVYPSLFYQAPLFSNNKSENDRVNWMIAQLERAHNSEQERAATLQQQAVLAESESARIKMQTMLDDLMRAEAEQVEQRRLAAFSAAVGNALTQNDDLTTMLCHCTDAMVTHLDAAFARIWTLNAQDNVLELQASSGMYTHINGGHSRVPVGMYKIGRIAQERVPHLTNDVQQDPRIGDPEWAAREGMVAFAGYPLIVGNELIGVMAMFARQPLTEHTLRALGAVSNSVALGIHRKWQEAELRQQADVLETIHRFGLLLTSELELEKIVQAVTNAATEVSRAQFGAFFYNVANAQGESYTLYALSGHPRGDFEKFPLPRNTAVFTPTFHGEGVVRLANVKLDPRYALNEPYFGMPRGHLPVTSYLAVPVISRSGEVLGGLFFGHAEPGVFTERAERIIVGLAAQAAIAMDNARLYQQAQEAVRVRDEFLSLASHELKTPLTSMVGYAELLKRRAVESEAFSADDRRALDVLAQQSERLNRMVATIFDLSRISTRTLSLTRTRVDLNALTCRIAAELQLLLTRHQLECEGAGVPLYVNGDELRLEQVLQNLIQNAAKYSPAGGTIRVQVGREGDEVYVAVSDEGIGIADEELPQLFQRFYRTPRAEQQHISGMGIGLYIVKEILTLHGGTIQVSSKVGEGSTFTLCLPLASPVSPAL